MSRFGYGASWRPAGPYDLRGRGRTLELSPEVRVSVYPSCIPVSGLTLRWKNRMLCVLVIWESLGRSSRLEWLI